MITEAAFKVPKLKCAYYSSKKKGCVVCDMIKNKQCDKVFDFDKPKEPIVIVEHGDKVSTKYECPTCKSNMWYNPKFEDDFRCRRCSQRIDWSLLKRA